MMNDLFFWKGHVWGERDRDRGVCSPREDTSEDARDSKSSPAPTISSLLMLADRDEDIPLIIEREETGLVIFISDDPGSPWNRTWARLISPKLTNGISWEIDVSMTTPISILRPVISFTVCRFQTGDGTLDGKVSPGNNRERGLPPLSSSESISSFVFTIWIPIESSEFVEFLLEVDFDPDLEFS
jgi:hypothetical protein